MDRIGPGAPRSLPPALRPGDRVSLVCASGPVTPPGRLDAAVAALESLGLRPVVSESCRSTYGYLAGPDELRAAELRSALEDPSTAAVLLAKGGYGAPRILDRVDWGLLAARPKILAGYSDVTALHLAAASVGVPSFHVPMASSDFADGLDSWTAGTFMQVLGAAEPLGPVALPPDAGRPRTLSGGVARGRLLGGNLSLIAATMGTPFQLDPRGAILFLEDVDEAPYRIDRMLTQLRLGGFFDVCAGVVLGDWRRCDPEPGKPSLSLETVFGDIVLPTARKRRIPVLADFPGGHRAPTAMFPLGVEAELDAERGILSILEAAAR